MKKDFVSVVFDRKKRLSASGEGKVELSIYLSRDERKYVTIRTCNKVQWKKYQKSEELAQEVSIYRSVIERMQENYEEMTIVNLDRHLGISKDEDVIRTDKKKRMSMPNGFITFMRENIEREQIKSATLTRKRVTIDAMLRYGKLNRFVDLTDKNVKGFDEFLRSECERSQPTLSNYHKIVKMYTKLAFQLGYITRDPYDSPLCHFERGKYKERRPLLEDELVQMRGADLTGKLARVRDLFIFCAYTGLSYADSQMFEYNTMTEVVGSNIYIDGKRVKTGCTFFTPILPPAMEVLERYDFQLPHISNQKANDYLHVIEEKMSLNKPLTMHVARHSFATLMLSYDIPIENVARMCGHENIKTTMVYAKILKSTINRNVDDKLDRLK